LSPREGVQMCGGDGRGWGELGQPPTFLPNNGLLNDER